MVKPRGGSPSPNRLVFFWTHRDARGTRTEKRPREDTVRQSPSARQAKRPQKKPDLPTPCTWTSAPRTDRQYTWAVQASGVWNFDAAAIGTKTAVDRLWRLRGSAAGPGTAAQSEQGR